MLKIHKNEHRLMERVCKEKRVTAMERRFTLAISHDVKPSGVNDWWRPSEVSNLLMDMAIAQEEIARNDLSASSCGEDHAFRLMGRKLWDIFRLEELQRSSRFQGKLLMDCKKKAMMAPLARYGRSYALLADSTDVQAICHEMASQCMIVAGPQHDACLRLLAKHIHTITNLNVDCDPCLEKSRTFCHQRFSERRNLFGMQPNPVEHLSERPRYLQ